MTGIFFDSLCHLHRCEDVPGAVQRAEESNINGILVPGFSPDSWQEQLHVQRPGIHLAYGTHPWAISSMSRADLNSAMDALEAVLLESPVPPVAIGEIGMDRLHPNPLLQADGLRMQLELANQHDLPIILHVVRSHGRVISILQSMGVPDRGGVVHACSASLDVAEEYVKLGLHLGVGRGLCVQGHKKSKQIAQQTPLDRLLVETDSPSQFREPADLKKVVRALSKIRATSIDEVGNRTAENARRLFNIND